MQLFLLLPHHHLPPLAPLSSLLLLSPPPLAPLSSFSLSLTLLLHRDVMERLFTAALLTALLSPGSLRTVSELSTVSKPSPESTESCSSCSDLLLQSNNMISSSSSKTVLYSSLLSLCARLPRQQASLCEQRLNAELSTILQQSHSPSKASARCVFLGLCAPTEEPEPREKLQSPVCSLCVMVVKKLETLLPENITEDALRALLSDVCALMPESYKQQCDDFVSKYGPEIIDFLLSSAAPHTICTLLHLCAFKTTPGHAPSDCDSCLTLSALRRLRLHDQNRTEDFLQSVCETFPHAIPKCSSFLKLHRSELLRVLGQTHLKPDACKASELCVPGPGLKPCLWGPSYWCRDVKTAQECGNQAFCKRFVWK